MKNKCQSSGFNLYLYTVMISLALSKDLSSIEQDILGNFFQTIGQNLCCLAAFSNDFEEICNSNSDNNSKNSLLF